MQRRRTIFFVMLFSFLLVSVGFAPAAAQAVVPITVGQNVQGELSQQQPSIEFDLTTNTPQFVTIQVLGLTPGLAPAFSVIAPSGVVVHTNENPGDANIVESTVNLTETGAYAIIVQRGSAAFGQFVLTVQTGAPATPPIPINLGQAITDAVDAQTSLRSYGFAASPNEVIVLNVQVPPGSFSGPNVTLSDAATQETLANSSARLLGVSYRLPPGNELYQVMISSSGAALQEPFTLCVGTEGGSAPCPASVVAFAPTALPNAPTPTRFIPVAIDPNAACQVASASGAVINVRSEPNTNSAVTGRLNPNTTALVIGRLPDGSWYNVNLNGLIGWIATSVVVAGGQCGGIPIVAPTSAAPPPTVTGLTATASATATATATATASNTPPPVATLNFSLPPVYGSTALTSGFVPDPFTVGITAGGPANVSYLGGGCSGYATSAPSFSVNYTAGAFPTLRFYFIGSGDTTMIINTPGGSYYCVDDSFGTLNPTIDFNSPSSGRYDVWIATFAPGASIGGTLYVTENTGNHP